MAHDSVGYGTDPTGRLREGYALSPAKNRTRRYQFSMNGHVKASAGGAIMPPRSCRAISQATGGIRVHDPYTHRTDWPKLLGRAALILGALALVAGVIYFMVPAHSLPSVMGRLPKASAHRTKRGLLSVIAGAVLVAGGGLALFQSRRVA
jgi:hypothetical protein